MKNTLSLNENYLFQRLYNKGNNVVEPSFVLYLRPNNLKVNRLGITVTKKIGSAPMRNRAKRRLKEAYRLHEDRIKIGYDIVLVSRVRTVNCEFDSIMKSLSRALKKTGALKNMPLT